MPSSINFVSLAVLGHSPTTATYPLSHAVILAITATHRKVALLTLGADRDGER